MPRTMRLLAAAACLAVLAAAGGQAFAATPADMPAPRKHSHHRSTSHRAKPHAAPAAAPAATPAPPAAPPAAPAS